MLATAAIVEAVAAAIEELELPLVVLDPVMVSKSGGRLLDDDGVKTMCAELIPRAFIVTPNLPEAEVLSGMTIVSANDAREAARRIHGIGGTAVLITGGHWRGRTRSSICCSMAATFSEFATPRIETPAHARHRLHARVGDRGVPRAGNARRTRRRGGPSNTWRARFATRSRSATATGPLDHFWKSPRT